MVQPFDGLAAAFASLIGSDAASAGLILGFVTVIALMLAFMLVLDKGEMQVGYVAGAVAVAFVVGVGWWEVWMIIFIAFIVLFAVLNPFERG